MTWHTIIEVLQWLFLLYLWSKIGILRVDIIDHDNTIDTLLRDFVNHKISKGNDTTESNN